VTETQFVQCVFTGMVAASGDGVHVLGAAGNLASRVWVNDCNFDGCSRFGVGSEQGWEYGWVTNNYFTACETDIAIVATANVNSNAILVYGNEINHTGSVRHAMRFEGDATGLLTMLSVADNVVLGGFATLSNTQYTSFRDNVLTSGVFASADAVVRAFGTIARTAILCNVIVRATGSSAGTCVTVEKSTGAPSTFLVGDNILVNEIATSGFVTVVDGVRFRVGGNLCRGTDAGASTVDAIDVQAVTVALTDALIGPGNQFSTAANTYRSGVRLLANGANITDASIVANLGDSLVYGGRFEVGGGGGTFNGQIVFGGNNWDTTTGDWLSVGTTVFPRLGFNAGTFGAQLFSGDGTPEAVVTARIASMYLRRDGGQSTSVYYKDNGTGSTGWIGIGGSGMVFGVGDTLLLATALFFAPGYQVAASAAELQYPVSRPATIRNLYVQVTGAGTGAATVTFTVRKNGADQTLLTTISNTATGVVNDVVNSFTVVAGDLISISITKSGAVAAGQTNVIASVEMA
jgi:hypothetical protein